MLIMIRHSSCFVGISWIGLSFGVLAVYWSRNSSSKLILSAHGYTSEIRCIAPGLVALPSGRSSHVGSRLCSQTHGSYWKISVILAPYAERSVPFRRRSQLMDHHERSAWQSGDPGGSNRCRFDGCKASILACTVA